MWWDTSKACNDDTHSPITLSNIKNLPQSQFKGDINIKKTDSLPVTPKFSASTMQSSYFKEENC